VDTIVTEMGYIKVVRGQGLVLEEIAPGLRPEEVQAATEPELIISATLKEMELFTSGEKTVA
jgi:acyl CoA:acetate/3-ketoacid CoA transferase beta subunit